MELQEGPRAGFQHRQKPLDPGGDGCVVADGHGFHGRRPLRDISCNALVNCGARLAATPGDARGKELGRRHHLDDDEARHTLRQFGDHGTRAVGDDILPALERGQ